MKKWTRMLAATLAFAFLLTACGNSSAPASSSAADDAPATAAGDWVLIHMTYNDIEVDAADLAELDTSVTLALAEDGTGTMDYDGDVFDLTWDAENITMDDVPNSYVLDGDTMTLSDADTEMVFARAGSAADVSTDAAQTPDTDGSTDTSSDSADNTSLSGDEAINFTPIASGLSLTHYSSVNMGIDIPEGWVIEEAPMTLGMAHVFWAYDPNCPVNQLLFGIKFEPLFVSETGRDYMSMTAGQVYGSAMRELYATAPVLTDPTTEGFFQIFSDVANTAEQNSASFGGTNHLPRVESFSVLERFDSGDPMASVALSSDLLHATFTQGGLEGEGMFSASIVPFATDMTGYYMAYDIMIMSAEKDQFQNWADILERSMKSLTYTDELVNAATAQSNSVAATSQSLSQAASEMSDTIMSSWETRNKSQDIISQKQSDATMGYERIVDTETGDIYQTDNGFTDWYDGTRYQSITDDQYTDAVKGVYHWK